MASLTGSKPAGAPEPGKDAPSAPRSWSQVATGAGTSVNGKTGPSVSKVDGGKESVPLGASRPGELEVIPEQPREASQPDAGEYQEQSLHEQAVAPAPIELENGQLSSPMAAVTAEQYQTLLSRIDANETALAALSSTVASLAEAVKVLTPGGKMTSESAASAAITDGTPTASPINTPSAVANGNASASPGPSLGSLAVQVAALSTSVAQLQRLQSGRSMRKSEDSLDGQSIAKTEHEDTNAAAVNQARRENDQGAPGSNDFAGGQGLSGQQNGAGFFPGNGRTDASQLSQSSLSSSTSLNPGLFAQQSLHRQAAMGQAGPAVGNRQQISGRPPQSFPSSASLGNGSLGGGQSAGMPSAATIPRLSGYGANNGQANLSMSSNQHALGNLGMRSGPMRPGMGRSVSSSVILPNLGLTPSGTQANLDASGLGPSGSRGNLGADAWPGNLRAGMKSPGVGGQNQQIGPGGRGGENASGTLTPGPGGLTVAKWDNLPLSPELLLMIAKYGIGPPNKVQARALPFMLKGSDIIAQAPPTQERIIAYVIPIIQLCLNLDRSKSSYKGPDAVVITTTVDQANQANKLIRDLGSPLGIRTALVVGPAGGDLSNEVRNIAQNAIQVIVGTPAKVHDLFAGSGGVIGDEVRLLVLDEVDQMIARNLYEHVTNVVKVFPQPKARGNLPPGNPGVIGTPAVNSPGAGSSYDPGMQSPFNPASKMPFPASNSNKFSSPPPTLIERQTCLFSNTIPTDVISFSQSIQVREPVRVLVRREGGAVNTSSDGPNSGHLRHYYLYLALASAMSSRTEQSAQGPGTIGSGRAQATGPAKTEASQAREYKLEALAGILEDYPAWQAIIHVGSQATLEAVVAKLNARHFETVYLHPDMSPPTRNHTMAMWRASAQTARGPRFLVVFDLVVKPPEVQAAPLVINFDLPRSVEAYAQRAAAAVQTPSSRQGASAPASVILNFIQAAGGDVEMLRSTECAYRFKCSEVPASLADLFT